MSGLRRVPPSPEVMAQLYMKYKRSGSRISFGKYLRKIGFVDPADSNVGMDDRIRRGAPGGGLQRIDIPERPVTGNVRVKVLLVDFSDRPGVLKKQHYEDLLFSDGVFPTGSMRDFYKEVSRGKVKITGSVHGWLRMPRKYSYYTNDESGQEEDSYPNNAKKLAEDAVRVALEKGIKFEAALDKFGDGVVTALFIVHSGRGAEEMADEIAGRYIWSHKWEMEEQIEVARDLWATNYLMVPQDCKVGVCCHELGHLAFQWQDFYDPDYDENRNKWSGSGRWDLMAGGSYNGNGARPAHPAGLHKLQHGWIPETVVNSSRTIKLKPYDDKSASVVRLVSPAYKPSQYLLLENRKRTGFDFDLPGAGLLVWKVDERGEQEKVKTAGLYLVQADGEHSLDRDWNEGDAGDPFPGTGKKTMLADTGANSTSFKGARSGITIKNIKREMGSGEMTLSVEFAAPRKRSRVKARTKKKGRARRRKR